MPFGPAQSLITRCPDCATAFRASAEQLSVRHGQVRCGRCGRVFDAHAHAVEAETAPAATTDREESSLAAPAKAADDEPPYDATSFIAATDGRLPSRLPASGEEGDSPSDTKAAGWVVEKQLGEAGQDAGNGQFGTLQGAPPAAAEAETPDQPVADAEPTPAESETSAAAEDIGSDDPGRDDGDRDTPTTEVPSRSFAEALKEAHADSLDDHGHQDDASAISNDDLQREDAADGASEPVQDDLHAASADADDTGAVDGSGGPITTTTDGSDGDIAADDSVAAALPDDRRDPIDIAAAEMPFSTTLAATTATPHVASPVEPLEREFGAPRNTRPGVSKWLGIPGIILLLAALAGQIAFHLRGDLVLLFPSARAAAVQLCDWAGCDLPSPQRAELMSIEASDLQADSNNPAVMVLSATLRNRAPFAQAQPALELTLTDAQDQPVARRVIDAGDYVITGIQNGVFPASSELPVKIYFEASSVKATGYRLYLFYP